jgi:Fe-S oxidoreductase
MCPSFRATGDEEHLTRGRANTLRLALSGQLGDQGVASQEVKDALDLCVSCKGCKRECPTGVDMAKMKVEFLHHYTRKHGLTLRNRIVAYLPRYAPWASRLATLFNVLSNLPGRETLTGLSAKRPLPVWHTHPFIDRQRVVSGGKEVVLFVDTFNRYFEPENARAALMVLDAAGYRTHVVQPVGAHERPLCCGRTFLAAGLVDKAKAEARRTLDALKPFVERGMPILGLEPSCLFSFRDEFASMLPGEATQALARQAMLFEEFLAQEADAGRLTLPLKQVAQKALLHGHCHQKAFAAMGAVEKALRLVPGLEVSTVESSCCGMAGSFGYEAEHYAVSMKMAEASLLPAVRNAAKDTLVVADGTSCRHQIADGAQRPALHVARVLAMALA